MTTRETYQRLVLQMLVAVTSLFWLISPLGGVWGQGTETPSADSPLNQTPSRLDVIFHEGQLTVDLQEADISEVLARIGRQAGISRVVGLTTRTQISAQFTGVPLEQALRHLLQRAGLSHAILYAQLSTRAASILEVRVFGGTSFEAPAALPDNAGDRDAQQEVAEEAGLDDLREVLTAAASIGDRERDAIAIHLRELLPWVAQQNFEALPSVVSYESNEAESAESAAGTLPQGAGASTVVGNGNLVHDQTTSR